ncbi:hypothetical protein RHGRI_026820 [Rhododendron griersonianum]|uniref:Fe2OG dioxygenase domain-containing protein n=1 Tax=Rhododendron griersonianum TaxID=479676 RepID=A0AAV6IU79_9ERIC|nr:hypothetical protein RHGRI_026820 [Rhododendron griersonianum]
MSLDGALDRRKDTHSATLTGAGNGNGNGALTTAIPSYSTHRLRLNPNTDHKPDSYEDLQLEFSPLLFSSLEHYLPPTLLNVSRESKVQYMREILLRYSPEGERTRVHGLQARHASLNKFSELHLLVISPAKQFLIDLLSILTGSEAQRIPTEDYIKLPGVDVSNSVLKINSLTDFLQLVLGGEPLHRELYTMHAANFFVPSFLKAVNECTEESFRSIMTEPSPGVFAFEMLQPHFCELLLAEVENFEKWVHETKFRIMRPNTMNKHGAVLDDFGLETMLDKLMEDFVRPMSRVFFPEVGGSTLDSHHGFVVEYGLDRDVDLGFHVDDSEVTINVCLGKQFSGGELFFRGIRCEKHVNTETQSEEIFDYSHVPGRAVLHRGRHRHGARATTSGHRINLLLWCRSSVFRELRKYQKDFSSWCGECQREKKERQRLSITTTKLELLKREGEAAKEAAS